MSETEPEYDENTADGLEPAAQPFEEPVGGGDPASTDGEDADLDLEPAADGGDEDQDDDDSA